MPGGGGTADESGAHLGGGCAISGAQRGPVEVAVDSSAWRSDGVDSDDSWRLRTTYRTVGSTTSRRDDGTAVDATPDKHRRRTSGYASVDTDGSCTSFERLGVHARANSDDNDRSVTVGPRRVSFQNKNSSKHEESLDSDSVYDSHVHKNRNSARRPSGRSDSRYDDVHVRKRDSSVRRYDVDDDNVSCSDDDEARYVRRDRQTVERRRKDDLSKRKKKVKTVDRRRRSGYDQRDDDSDFDRSYRRRKNNRDDSRDRKRRSRKRSVSQTTDSDDDSCDRKRRHRLKPPKFDGTGSYETFYASFQNCADYNKWSGRDKLAHLKNCLVGAAAQILWDSSPESTDTLQKLVELLKVRFSGCKQADKFRMELRVRRRQTGESLSDLHRDIRRLIALAFPDLQQSYRDVIACDYFIDSLDDSEFALKVRERNPASLDDALKVALQLEAWRGVAREKNDESRRFSSGKQVFSSEKQVRGVKTDAKDKTENIQALNSEIDRLKNQVKELSAWRQSVNQQSAGQFVCSEKVRGGAPAAAYVGPGDQTQVNTGGGGGGYHSPHTSGYGQQYGQADRKPTTCWSCGLPGHRRKDCLRSVNDSAVFETRNVNEPNVAVRGLGVDDTAVYLKARLGRKPVFCLLDTGSDVSIVPNRLIKNLRGVQLAPSERSVCAANGSRVDLVGQAVIPLTLNGQTMQVNVLVSDDVAELMLGADWLKCHHCVWDFSLNRLYVDGRLVIPRSRKGSFCRRVYLEQDVTIPPKRQMSVPVRAPLNRLSDASNSDFVLEPRCVSRGVYTARTAMSAAPSDLCACIINTTSVPQTLRAGTLIGKSEPALVFTENNETPEMFQTNDERTENSVDENNSSFCKEAVIDKLCESLPAELTAEQKGQTKELLVEFADVFSMHDYDIGRTDLVYHRIDTGDHRPIRQTLRRQPAAYLDIIDKQVQDMLQHDVIEKSNSPWASNVILARKKDGNFRFCVDYRALNSITVQDAYPLPHIESCIDAVRGSVYFSTLDLRAGYFNVPIFESDRDKTSFVTRRGSYRFKVMPFGLTCAPSEFQRLMDLVLCGLSFEVCMVFLDDVVIFSTDFSSHLSRLRAVFQRLRWARLKLKPSKCCLLRKKISFLGHVISSEGVEMQAEKVAAVRDWPIPRNLHELRSFLGLLNYYRKFLPGFSQVAAPLYALLKKNAVVLWTDEQQRTFERLKELLTSGPILAFPRNEGTFIIDCDSSETGLGTVCSQMQDGVERVIGYASRTLNRSELNYSTTRKELLAVIFSLKSYRYLLLGRRFLIRSDHSALQYLRKTKEPIAQEARWLEFLGQFDFDIIHRPGARHGNADSLSRRPPVEDASDVTTNDTAVFCAACKLPQLVNPDLSSIGLVGKGDLAQKQASDPEIGRFVELICSRDNCPSVSELQRESEITKMLCGQWFRFTVRDNVVYRILFGKNGETDMTPECLKNDILRASHEGMSGGHFGIKRTCDQLQRRAFWFGWRRSVERFFRECTNCNCYHRGRLPRKSPLQPIATGAPFERLSIDLTGPHKPTRRGSVYILTCVEPFTKWAESFPLRNKESATVAKVLVEKVFCRFGVPLCLLSDNGNEVDSAIMRDICKFLGVDKLHTTVYKPSTNASCERFHRTLNAMIGKVLNDDQSDWDLILPFLMAAYRSTRHEVTGYSPNFLTLGREVRAPIDLILGTGQRTEDPRSYDNFVDELKQRMLKAYEIVRKHSGLAAERTKRYYDMHVKPAKFSEGDLVFYFNPRSWQNKQNKWLRKFSGPYRVKKVLGPVNLLLQKSQDTRPFVAHSDKVKSYIEQTGQVSVDDNSGRVQNEPSVGSDGDEVVSFCGEDCKTPRPKRVIRRPARFSE